MIKICICGMYFEWKSYPSMCESCCILRQYGIKHDYDQAVKDSILKYSPEVKTSLKKQSKLKTLFDEDIIKKNNEIEKRKKYCFFKNKSLDSVNDYLKLVNEDLNNRINRLSSYKEKHGHTNSSLASRMSYDRRMIRLCNQFIEEKKCRKGCCIL